jgi:Protein of unknown function (DUF2934)
MKRKSNGADIGSQDKGPLIAGLVLDTVALAAPKKDLSAEIKWTQTAHKRSVDSRHSQIASAAYYLSEARGFAPGHEEEDWLLAQMKIDAFDSGIN